MAVDMYIYNVLCVCVCVCVCRWCKEHIYIYDIIICSIAAVFVRCVCSILLHISSSMAHFLLQGEIKEPLKTLN